MDTLAFWYFLTHVPVTVLVDSQAVLPATGWVPAVAREALQSYVDWSQDPLMDPANRARPDTTWFRALIVCELMLQLPIFMALIYGYWPRTRSSPSSPSSSSRRPSPSPSSHPSSRITSTTVTTAKRARWVHALTLVYGVHVATTLVPVLATVGWQWRRYHLVAIYLPYLILPTVLAVRSFHHLFPWHTLADQLPYDDDEYDDTTTTATHSQKSKES